MQILVVYHTRTGNTKRLAEAIAAGAAEVSGTTVTVKTAAEVTGADFLAARGIIVGSPCYFGSMAAEVKAMFDRLVGVRNQMADRIGAAFAAAGDPNGGKETTLLSILQAMLIYGMVVVGDPLDASGHYGVAATGDPDRMQLAHAGKLGRRVATLVARLGGG